MTSSRAKGAAGFAASVALAAWAGVAVAAGGTGGDAAGPARTVDYVDPEAGVRFPVPFAAPIRKTGAQVKALVLDHPDVTLPDGARFTSGLYAPSGLPFIVVWMRRDRSPPTRALLSKLDSLGPAALHALYGLDALRFQPPRLRGIGDLSLPGGLKGKILVQIARGETIGVGYFDAESADFAPFAQLAQGFELAAPKRLAWEDLPHGGWYWARVGAAGVAFMAAAATAVVWQGQRSKRAAAPRDELEGPEAAAK